MVILDSTFYGAIRRFIKDFRGLSFDCEQALQAQFPTVPNETLKSILQKEKLILQRYLHPRVSAKAAELLHLYESRIAASQRPTILLEMALEQNFSPLSFARILLVERFKECSRNEIKEMIRNFNLIPDPHLAANVSYCLFNDQQEGSLVDSYRRCIGEEYELRLKQRAREVGMVFYDEGDLRREGYDKTPDLKLAVPVLARGKVINWIESKAQFGDVQTHEKYLREQLISYTNRFGAGLVIYWFGYLEEIVHCREESGGGDQILISDDFPQELEFLQFNQNEKNKM